VGNAPYGATASQSPHAKFLDITGSATLLTELRATNQHVSTAKNRHKPPHTSADQTCIYLCFLYLSGGFVSYYVLSIYIFQT